MFKRMFLMLALTALVLAGLGAVKFQQIQTAAAQAANLDTPEICAVIVPLLCQIDEVIDGLRRVFSV